MNKKIGRLYPDSIDAGFYVKGKTMTVRYHFDCLVGGTEEFDGEHVYVFTADKATERKIGRKLPDIHLLNT